MNPGMTAATPVIPNIVFIGPSALSRATSTATNPTKAANERFLSQVNRVFQRFGISAILS